METLFGDAEQAGVVMYLLLFGLIATPLLNFKRNIATTPAGTRLGAAGFLLGMRR